MKFETGGWGHAEYLSGGSWLHGSVEPARPGGQNPGRRRRPLLRLRGEDRRRLRGLGQHRLRVRPLAVLLAARRRRLEGEQAGRADHRPDVAANLERGRLAQAGRRRRSSRVNTLSRSSLTDNTRTTTARRSRIASCSASTRSACTRARGCRTGRTSRTTKRIKEIDKEAAAAGLRRQGRRPAASAASRRWAGRGRSPASTSRRSRTAPSRSRHCPCKADDLHWKGIHVPGNRDDERPDLQYAHRFVYRTRLNVPAECKGRACFLHFPCNAVISSVFVNGVYCGGSKAALHRLGLRRDQGDQAGRGQRGLSSPSKIRITPSPTPATRRTRRCATCSTCRPTGSTAPAASAPRATPTCRCCLQVRGAGIFETPSFVVAGPAYTSDVFAMPSVKKKELGLEISVANPTGAPIDGEDRQRGRAARRRRRRRRRSRRRS